MPNDIMYCTKCGKSVGPNVQKCPECFNTVFANIPFRGRPVKPFPGLLGVMDEWEKTGKTPKMW